MTKSTELIRSDKCGADNMFTNIHLSTRHGTSLCVRPAEGLLETIIQYPLAEGTNACGWLSILDAERCSHWRECHSTTCFPSSLETTPQDNSVTMIYYMSKTYAENIGVYRAQAVPTFCLQVNPFCDPVHMHLLLTQSLYFYILALLISLG